MAYEVRPFTEADSSAVLAVADAAIPYDPDGNRRWLRQRREVNEQHTQRRHYVVNNDLQGIVAYGAIEQQERDRRRLRLYLLVYPGYLRSGEGRSLYNQLMNDTKDLKTSSLWMQEYEQNTELSAFMGERGFVQTRLTREMQLTLARANLAQKVPIIEEVANRGIIISILEDERKRDSNTLAPRLHKLYNAIQQGTHTPLGYPEFVQLLNRSPIIPQAFFLAHQNDHLLGLSTLARIENDTQQALQLWTGVLPNFRRQHIATAMRLCTIDAAMRLGFLSLVTYTDHQERIMRMLNERLGFQSLFAYITLEKTLT